MNQWQERELLEKICEAVAEQRERIVPMLANIAEEDLCDELNVMLCQSRMLARKAQKHLPQETGGAYDGSDRKTSTGYHVPEQIFLKQELSTQQRVTEQMKYCLHENRNAGIFASEMAKEWIRLQEDSGQKLKQYLDVPSDWTVKK